jgi:hypothetical protein
MKDFLIKNIKGYLQESVRLVKKESLDWKDSKYLGEIALAIYDILDKLVLVPHERVLLERLFHAIQDKLFNDNNLFFYISFYKIPQTVFTGDSEKINKLLYKVNIDINIMRVRIRSCELANYILGDSTDDYFFNRIDGYFVRGMKNLFEYGHEEVYVPALYALLNLHQALYEYIICRDTKYQEKAIDLIGKIYMLINTAMTKKYLQEKVYGNLQLRMFLMSQLYLYSKIQDRKVKINLNLEELFKQSNPKKRIWGYISLFELDKEVFESLFQKDFEENFYPFYAALSSTEKLLLLRSIVYYLNSSEQRELDQEIGVPILGEFKPNSWFKIEDYINGYDLLHSVTITEEEHKRVLEMDDEELRGKFKNTLKNLDINIIQREAVKPHGVFEISDMEIPFRRGGQLYHLCLPFKSGKEIAKTVPESIAYQVIRPFTYFGDKCVVIFVSAKKSSQAFHNYIKRAQALFNWTIYVIEGEELTKLLKYNGQLV